MAQSPLRVGYVPEHFSTPLHFAQKYFDLGATLIAFPSGTGHMVTSLQSNEIDIGIGLSEGWVSALGKLKEAACFKLEGRYVQSPLCWSISTGADKDLDSVEQLKGKKIGVSRVGSGSYVMGFVLAESMSWLQAPDEQPFEVVPLQTFANLRDAVADASCDFFMWEQFTSKRYHDNGSIKKIGEIYTPWPSWLIAARDDARDLRLDQFFHKLDRGIEYFEQRQEEAVQYISTSLDYSEEDAKAWLKTVQFEPHTKGVDMETVHKTVGVLKKARALEGEINVASMVGRGQEL